MWVFLVVSHQLVIVCSIYLFSIESNKTWKGKLEEVWKYLQAFRLRETNPYKCVSHKDWLRRFLFLVKIYLSFPWDWELDSILGSHHLLSFDRRYFLRLTFKTEQYCTSSPKVICAPTYHWQCSEACWLNNNYIGETSRSVRRCPSLRSRSVGRLSFVGVWNSSSGCCWCISSCGFLAAAEMWLCNVQCIQPLNWTHLHPVLVSSPAAADPITPRRDNSRKGWQGPCWMNTRTDSEA